LSVFQFKYFSIEQFHSSLKVGTDAMLLGAFVGANHYQSILDIGTGTGVLALMTKQTNPTAKVTAIDLDEQALIDCQNNFSNSPWKHDFKLICGDFLLYCPNKQFDCIICNPPYYENGLLSESERINTSKHTSSTFLETLLLKGISHLKEHGDFWLILPIENSEKWIAFLENNGNIINQLITICSKVNQPKRIVLKIGKIEKEFTNKKQTFIIRNSDNSYTDEYKQLTKDFHNKAL